jgi:hypothetical protein
MSIRHLNQNQLAERWNISPRTLEGWRSRGEGVVFLKIGGRVAYRLEDIEKYEIQQLRANTAIVRDVAFPGEAPERCDFREALAGRQRPHEEHPIRSPAEQNGNFYAANGLGRIKKRIRTHQ